MSNRKGFTPHKYSTHEEDKIQIELALGGSERAFSHLFRRFKPIMYSVCKRRFKHMSVEDIEDEVLMFFGKIFTKLDLYDPEKATFATWITFCWHNHMNSMNRKKKTVSTKSIEDMYNYDDDDTRTWDPVEEGLDTARFVDINMSYIAIYKMMLRVLTKKEAKFAIAQFYHGMNTTESEKYSKITRGSGAHYRRNVIEKINKGYKRERYL